MTGTILYDHPSSICSQMARLALVEKRIMFRQRTVDIMETHEQFEPWYVALNPRAVVPTLKLGDEVITDTIRIVTRVQALDGPDLSGGATTQTWLRDIMALHYGVLLYRNRLNADGAAPQILARGQLLERLQQERPDLSEMLAARRDGNRRFQALLGNPNEIETHLAATRALIDRMIAAVSQAPFLSGATYSLADCFATAALARFTIHRLTPWWRGTPLEAYYDRMKRRPSFVDANVIDTGSERDL